MGLSPGSQGRLDVLIEDTVQVDQNRYVALHERFIDENPEYQRLSGGKSPFWNNLHSKLMAMLPEETVPSNKWSAYRAYRVAQDILPFRSTHRSTSAEDLRPGSTLARIAAATLAGLQHSEAHAAFVFTGRL